MSKFDRWCVYLFSFCVSITAVRAIARYCMETYESVSQILAVILVLGLVMFLIVGVAELVAWVVRKR